MAKKSLHCRHRRVCKGVCVHFLCWVWHAPNRCLEHHCMRRCVRKDRFLSTPVYMFVNTLSAGCEHVLVCAVYSFVLGDEGRGVQTVYAGHLLLAWGVIFDRRRDRGVVCMYPIFDGGLKCMCACVCVYTPTPTQMHVRYLDVIPGVRTRHLESPKNPYGINLSTDVFVYVYRH